MSNNNNKKNIYSIVFLIAFIYIIPLVVFSPLPQFYIANGQVDPSQEQIEPIPPSNNTNNQTGPIVISQ